MSQKRGQTGTSMVFAGRHSPVSGVLSRVAEKVAAEEHKKAQEVRRAKAAKADGRIGGRVRYSDAEIAEMRRLHQFGGKTTQQLAALYEVDDGWMHQVLIYAIRSRYVYA